MNYLMLEQLYQIAKSSSEFNEVIREELRTIKVKTINEKKLYKKVKTGVLEISCQSDRILNSKGQTDERGVQF